MAPSSNTRPNPLYSVGFILSSFSLAFGSLYQLSSTDRVSVSRGIGLTSLGFIYWIALTNFFNKMMLGTKLGLQFVKYYKLSLSEVLEITNKLVSAIQASLSCLFGFFVCQWSCSRNFLTTSHFLSESYAWFAAAYFFFDVWSMFKVYNTKIYDKMQMKMMSWNHMDSSYYKIPSWSSGELSVFKQIVINKQKIPSFLQYITNQPLIIFHHMFIGGYGLAFISSLRGGLGDCIFSFMYMMEASTPFVSFRSILSILKMKATKWYIVNGLIMLATFFIFRIVMLPTVMYWYAEVINTSYWTAIAKLPLGCKISILAMFLPQFYWFYLMLKGATKIFTQPKMSKQSNNLKTE